MVIIVNGTAVHYAGIAEASLWRDRVVRIGLTTYYEKIEGQFSTYIPYDYIGAVLEYDAVPLLIPVTDDDKILEKYLSSVEGVLLTGGVDIDPGLYNEKNTGLSHAVCKQRDRAEMYIIDRALKKGLPILGICRGFQILNVFLGGTLYQDIQNLYNTGIVHSNPLKKRTNCIMKLLLILNRILGGFLGSGGSW